MQLPPLQGKSHQMESLCPWQSGAQACLFPWLFDKSFFRSFGAKINGYSHCIMNFSIISLASDIFKSNLIPFGCHSAIPSPAAFCHPACNRWKTATAQKPQGKELGRVQLEGCPLERVEILLLKILLERIPIRRDGSEKKLFRRNIPCAVQEVYSVKRIANCKVCLL